MLYTKTISINLFISHFSILKHLSHNIRKYLQFKPFLGPFRCPDCGKPYTYRKSFLHHKKFQCTEKLEFQCPADNCPYKCDLKSTLTRHVKLMHLPLVGDLLQKLGFQKAKARKLTSHFVFPCPKCHKVFSYKASLHDHQTYQCGKEPQFRCGKEGCSYISYFKRNVAIHIKHSHKVDYDEVYKRFEEQLKGIEGETAEAQCKE